MNEEDFDLAMEELEADGLIERFIKDNKVYYKLTSIGEMVGENLIETNKTVN